MSAIRQGMNGRNSDAPQGPLMTPKQTLGLRAVRPLTVPHVCHLGLTGVQKVCYQ